MPLKSYEIRKGSFNTPIGELIKVREIYSHYKDREAFHILFTNLIIPSSGTFLLLGGLLTFRWYRRRTSRN